MRAATEHRDRSEPRQTARGTDTLLADGRTSEEGGAKVRIGRHAFSLTTLLRPLDQEAHLCSARIDIEPKNRIVAIAHPLRRLARVYHRPEVPSRIALGGHLIAQIHPSAHPSVRPSVFEPPRLLIPIRIVADDLLH